MKWTTRRPFLNPEEGGYLFALFGPGEYELRDSNKNLVGKGGNVTFQITSLLPVPLRTGTRKNEKIRKYVLDNLDHAFCRTKARKIIA